MNIFKLQYFLLKIKRLLKKYQQVLSIIIFFSLIYGFRYYEYLKTKPVKIDGISAASKEWYSKPDLKENLIEAKYYKKIGLNKIQCLLCPNYCVLRKNETGLCNVRKNISGKLYSTSYQKSLVFECEVGNISHPFTMQCIEQKSLSIGGVGCSLNCDFCLFGTLVQNEVNKVYLETIPEDKIIEIAKNNNLFAINYTLNEPFANYEYTFNVAKLAHENGIKNSLATCGYISEEPFNELITYVDKVIFGLKGFSNEFYQKYTLGDLDTILNNMLIAKKRGVVVEVMYLLIPNLSDSKEHIKRLSLWIKDNLGVFTPLVFVRYIPSYKLSNLPPTPVDKMLMAINIAKNNGLRFIVPYAHIMGFDDDIKNNEILTSMYCPHCQKKLTGYDFIDEKSIFFNHLKNYRCGFCNGALPGITDYITKKR